MTAVQHFIKLREGFSTLTSKQAEKMLRAFDGVTPDTDENQIYPSLRAMDERFVLDLKRAEEEAHEILDEILSEGDQPLMTKVDLKLRNREIRTEQDVRTLLAEIEQELLEQLRAGHRVRLA